MSFLLKDDCNRTLEIQTDNDKSPCSVFITCGSFAFEVSKAAFMDAIRSEVQGSVFDALVRSFYSGPAHVRAA